MATLTNTLDYGSAGTALSLSNSNNGGDPFQVIIRNNVPAASYPEIAFQSSPTGIARSPILRVEPLGKTYFRWNVSIPDSRVVFRRPLFFQGTPSTSTTIVTAMRSVPGNVSVWVDNQRRVYINNGSGGLDTRSAALALDTLYWVEGALRLGSGGGVDLRITDENNLTVHTGTWNTDLGGGSVTEFRFESSTVFGTYDWLFDIQAGALESGWLGPIGSVEQLGTPTLTLVSDTPASDVSATDRVVTVSWPPVPDAGGYRALAAPYGTTAYETLSESVTSPHTFTGRPAGGQRVAIQAKP